MDKSGYIVDSDGVIVRNVGNIDNLFEVEAGDRILRKKNLEGVDKLVEIKMRFAKVNYVVFGDIIDKYPVFAKMIKLIGYYSGRLMYKNGVSVNRRNLSKACGVSNATINRQLRGLINDDVIKVVREGREAAYFVNPYVVHLGKKVNLSLYELFKDTIYRENYEKTLRSDK
jgi:hypothetical protein